MENKNTVQDAFYNEAISLKNNFEDLTFIIIPKFRLYRDAEIKYTCYSNIEDFIVFEEPVKYLRAIIQVDSTFLSSVSVPNFIFEFQRIYTPDVFTINLQKKYVEKYLDEFTISFMKDFDFIKKEKNNFFFELYGLDNVVFEIDINTGILYANQLLWSAYGEKGLRMLANEFIRKYIGKDIILKLARGDYREVDVFELQTELKDCDDSVHDEEQVLLKIKK